MAVSLADLHRKPDRADGDRRGAHRHLRAARAHRPREDEQQHALHFGGDSGAFLRDADFQSLPVALARALGWNFWGQVAASNALFALAHFRISVSTGIAAGIMSGFYIAFTYVHWRQTSFRAALWMTAGLHALHNLFLVAPLVLARLIN